jgi:hypothetical protein
MIAPILMYVIREFPTDKIFLIVFLFFFLVLHQVNTSMHNNLLKSKYGKGTLNDTIFKVTVIHK